MRMRQTIDELEEAFHEHSKLDRKRRERLRRQAVARSRKRRIEKTEKRGNVRFSVLVLALTATVVGVSVGMFNILTLLLG